MRDRWEWQATFLGRIASQGYVEGLFDRLADIVYSIKDRQGRYVLMSAAAVARCHLPSKAHAVGLTAFDLFPAPMAERYARQDEQVFRTGKPVLDSLDLTLYPDHATGWCISTKMPLHDSAGQVVGLADAVEYMHAHLCEPLREMQLERLSGLTAAQFERRMRKLFQLSPARYLLKLRIDSAAQWLVRTDKPIGEIAQLTGFCDQSGLSRHFRNLTGLTPRQYRQLNRPGI
ncbi:MAG: hypothetical protein BGO50_15120 [Rhodanobacter sp. 67-28]|nr:MAG: hypothetical protein BGO50_15120 [Rhodanobacter sp. 67-28]